MTCVSGSSKIRVCENGILIVDGGTINNADLELISGSKLIIRNGGVVNMANGRTFEVPVGATLEIENGFIN